jgi:Holliday junction resolvasome RuvABC endonuclease subunit
MLELIRRAEYVVLGIDPGTGITGYGVVGQTVHGDMALLACGVAPDARPQTLSVEQWLALAAAIGPLETAADRP